MSRFETILRIIPRNISQIFPAWKDLVLTHKVSGIQVHDARIVAAMLVHQVNRILTFDVTDFRRYALITTLHPGEVV